MGLPGIPQGTGKGHPDTVAGTGPERPPPGAGTGRVPTVRTVLVALDGSPVAERAIAPAAGIAALLGADLGLVSYPFELGIREKEIELRQVATWHGFPTAQIQVSPGASFAAAVIRASRGAADSLVVMPTHGASGTEHEPLGGTANAVVHELDDPVVLIGPHYEPRGVPQSLIVCWDGSPSTASVIPLAARWTAPLGLPVHLVHLQLGQATPLEAEVKQSEGSLAARVLTTLSVGDRLPEVIEIGDEDPVATVGRWIEGQPASLLVLATHEPQTDQGGTLGPITAGIVRASPHPVFIHHQRV